MRDLQPRGRRDRVLRAIGLAELLLGATSLIACGLLFAMLTKTPAGAPHWEALFDGTLVAAGGMGFLPAGWTLWRRWRGWPLLQACIPIFALFASQSTWALLHLF